MVEQVERPAAKCFEDLWIWRQARVLVRHVYGDTLDGSASARDFAFRDQIRRAAISVMNNIAEGFERGTDADFARFLGIAKASCGEVRSMYYLAEDCGYVEAPIAEERRRQTREISSGIATLIVHLRGAA
ncbi:MAG: four helix bundle protein [Acidobacteriota bacterium]